MTADAPPPTPKRWWVGAKAGFLMGGSATIEWDLGEADIDTESGLFVTAGVDAAMGPRLSIGGFAMYASTGIEDWQDATISAIGGTIKGRFAAARRRFARARRSDSRRSDSIGGWAATPSWAPTTPRASASAAWSRSPSR